MNWQTITLSRRTYANTHLHSHHCLCLRFFFLSFYLFLIAKLSHESRITQKSQTWRTNVCSTFTFHFMQNAFDFILFELIFCLFCFSIYINSACICVGQKKNIEYLLVFGLQAMREYFCVEVSFWTGFALFIEGWKNNFSLQNQLMFILYRSDFTFETKSCKRLCAHAQYCGSPHSVCVSSISERACGKLKIVQACCCLSWNLCWDKNAVSWWWMDGWMNVWMMKWHATRGKSDVKPTSVSMILHF